MAQGSIPNLLGQIIMENDIFKKEHIYVCVCVWAYVKLSHFAIQQRLVQHCESILL